MPVNGPGVSEKMNISPCSTRCCPSGYYAAGKQPLALLHGIFFLIFSKTPGVYKPPAVPSGSAQGAHYPAGTRRDIQAVTGSGFEIMSHDHHDDVRRTRRLSLGSARRPGGPAARVSWRPWRRLSANSGSRTGLGGLGPTARLPVAAGRGGSHGC